MAKFRQISFADQPYALGDEWLGTVLDSPENIAAKLGLEAERTFDDLDYFSFLGLQVEVHRFGFQRYRGSQKVFSVITVGNGSKTTFDDVKRICANLFGQQLRLLSKEESDQLR